MFVAYAIPKEDHHLLVEDGIGLLATGNTKEEAEAKVRKLFETEQDEMAELSKKHGYTEGIDERLVFEDFYILHTNEV